MGVLGWPPKTCPRPFSNVAPRWDRCPLSRGNSNPGGPIIFRRKIEGCQSNPAGGERGLGQGWVCGGQYPGGLMNSKALLPLQTDPIHRIGGELRIFSQLRISDRFRGMKPDCSEGVRRAVKRWTGWCQWGYWMRCRDWKTL
jgi:hypothetical protein